MAEHGHLANLLDLLFHRFAQAFQFDEQHRGRIHRIAGVGGLFHHAQHDAVQHLDGHRRDGARRDFGHRVGGRIRGIENCQQRLDQLRLAHQPHHDFRDQRHGAFRAGEQPGEIVARRIQFLAAGGINLAIRRYEFQAQHVVGGDAVGERVRPAGVLRHVAANGAGALAGRIGRVEILPALRGQRQIEIHHARLDHGALVGVIDFENPVHARETDDDAAGARNGSAAQAGARAAAHDGDAVLAADLDDSHDVFGRARKTTISGRALSTLPSYS